jgi:hypothetical protein
VTRTCTSPSAAAAVLTLSFSGSAAERGRAATATPASTTNPASHHHLRVRLPFVLAMPLLSERSRPARVACYTDHREGWFRFCFKLLRPRLARAQRHFSSFGFLARATVYGPRPVWPSSVTVNSILSRSMRPA